MSSQKYLPKPYTRSRQRYSPLQRERLAASCRDYCPAVLERFGVPVKQDAVPADPKDAETIKQLFPSTNDTPLVEFAIGAPEPPAGLRDPVKVGVVLSGGQAPGGHNVIAGIFDGIKQWHPDSVMIGFIDGPHGVFTGNFVEITHEIMDSFRNSGGFDMLGSGRHKIETEEQFQNSMDVCSSINLDGLVVIGGDDSNTNGALLAEYFKANGCKTKVVGAPKTIDGDLKCPPHLPISFGFDTACRTYATLVGNVAIDALSTQKYYHIVRLMGRSASNIALEVALLTRPNACLIGEEVKQGNKSLRDITKDLADMIEMRSQAGKDYGVILLPEGLIEFIPEFEALIKELNDKLADPAEKPTEERVLAILSEENANVFKFLPDFIRAQLLLDRDPHGNVQVAKIETEKLLAATVSSELEHRRGEGSYGGSFKTQFHAYGYEGRAGMPTIFDASYCYALGATAAALLVNGNTGLLASVKNLLAPVKEWVCGGVPVTSLCVIERRKGKEKPVIRKALVEMEGDMAQPYQEFMKMREELKMKDYYSVPGPIQYDMVNCPTSTDVPLTLRLELGASLKPLVDIPEAMRMGQHLYTPQPAQARSDVQQWRMQRTHQVPEVLKQRHLGAVDVSKASPTIIDEQHVSYFRKFFSTMVEKPLVEFGSRDSIDEVSKELKVGVVFSGRQAPGCHDLLCGLVDMLASSEGGKLLGFVGGTKGLCEKQVVELTPELCKAYAGTGGLELLGRTVDRLNTDEELEQARAACTELGLTGLVLVGGTRSNTDAAYLAEYFRKEKVPTAVVGVPCGIEGNMTNEFVETSIGFDSSAKAVAQLVGNTAIDGSSARKYYYFLRLMDGAGSGGRISSSHQALEVALQTKPNLLLLSEKVDAERMSLRDLVKDVAETVAMRSKDGLNFGTIIVAEGLLGAIPEFRSLISELESLPMPSPVEKVLPELTSWSRALFRSLPDFIQEQLLRERGSDAAIQMSQLETERLLATLVEEELKQQKNQGTYKGSFSPVCQFIGYQARCSVPSNFDMDYAYALGATSAILATTERSGYMAIVSNLSQPPERWVAGGVPLTAMLSVSSTAGDSLQMRPSILPRQVDLEGAAFRSWWEQRIQCAKSELYENPGPIQFSGPTADTAALTITSKHSYVRELDSLNEALARLGKRCRPGADPKAVRVADKTLKLLHNILDELSGPPDLVTVE